MAGLKADCLIFRTNVYNKKWHQKLLAINGDVKVIVIADIRKEMLPYDGLELVFFDFHNIDKLGLSYDEEVQWRCGDYAYYLAYSIYKYKYAWMIEPDCLINDIGIEDILSLKSDVDFISCYNQVAEDGWYWKKNSHYGDNTMKCFFPVTRISGNATSQLLNARKEFGSVMNDESFVISELSIKKFKVKELNSIIKITYNKNIFSYRKVHYYHILKLLIFFGIVKGNLFHPVYYKLSDYILAYFKKRTWKFLLGIDKNIT